MEKAIILDIQRMSTEDGPGLRTTVFFKGCSLHCAWCHNPESIAFAPVVQWQQNRCIGCHTCEEVCPTHAIRFSDSGVLIDSKLCNLCGVCVDECPSGALHIKGVSYTVDGLFKELVKDKVYFGQEGGVTLSGGEVLMQGAFAIKLLEKLKKHGVGTALDTAGCVPYATLQEALQYTDILLYDLKLADSDEHKKFTGAGNELILSNLLEAVHAGGPWKLWIRTPIIPGATDREANIRHIARFIHDHLEGRVEKWELTAFNNLCRDKYRMLGIPWAYQTAKLMKKETMDALVKVAQEEIDDKDRVRWTGVAE